MLPLILLSTAQATEPTLAPLTESTEEAPPADTNPVVTSNLNYAKVYTAAGVGAGVLGLGCTAIGASMIVQGLNDTGEYAGLTILTGTFAGAVGVAGLTTGAILLVAGQKKREEAQRAALTVTPTGVALTGRF